MSKLPLMILQAMVPVTRTHDVEAALKSSGAKEIMWRPYLNGQEPEKKRGGPPPGTSTVQRSAEQQAWLAKHAKGTFNTLDLIEGWMADGWRREAIYGALVKAAEHKLVKKLGAGKYRRIG